MRETAAASAAERYMMAKQIESSASAVQVFQETSSEPTSKHD